MPIQTAIDSISQNQGSPFGFKNRIINGGMVIDQRNAGASGTAVSYTVDRWAYYGAQSAKGTWQQNAGSVTPPSGFTNYLGFTSSSSYSVLSTDQFFLYQTIEGLNCSDLNWGSVTPATVTLSFWVRSSLTGTFGGVLQNNGATRNYPFSFTINSANTWEKETITIPGDTTGTWLTTSGWGIRVAFNLGTGATYSSTANQWTGTSFITAPTGAVSVVGTNGATFYVTGVQLEVGRQASSFDFRSYTNELQLCQRYYQTYPGVGQGNKVLWSSYGATYNYVIWSFKTTMRISPTVGGATMGTVETPSPDAVTAYASGSNYAAYGYNGSSYGQATATAEL